MNITVSLVAYFKRSISDGIKRNKLFVGTILIKNGTISMKVGTIAVP